MFYRLSKLPESNSFFLFGARGTGKSTHLRSQSFFDLATTLWIDLLDSSEYERYQEDPSQLSTQILARKELKWVVIDEVQRCPELLNLVHLHIEESKRKGKPLLFALTGSSARKLRRGKANLLAGRAWLRNMYPLTHKELGEQFDLTDVLEWGSLPSIFSQSTGEARKEYLSVYTRTYVTEEIIAEQIVRELLPFRKFLRVAAQCNGLIINSAKIARDIGTDHKTVQSYFQILEDTYLGYFLHPFHSSVRKRYRLKPKFYFFDLGVNRSLAQMLEVHIVPGTYAYGAAFEHFFILECMRLNEYGSKDFTFTYYRSKDDAEIDLVVERPGKKLALIEIKSGVRVDPTEVRSFERLAGDFEASELYYISQDPTTQKMGKVLCLNWRACFEELFGG